MSAVARTLRAAALACFACGAGIHAAAYAGLALGSSTLWPLHLACLALWLLAIGMTPDKPRAIDALFKPAPGKPVFERLITVFFIYALLNFSAYFFGMPGHASPEGGRILLRQHGQLLGQISEARYHAMLCAETRAFTGHWMAFFAMAAQLFGKLR